MAVRQISGVGEGEAPDKRMAAMENQVKKLTESVETMVKQTGPGGSTCYGCGMRGHFARNCPQAFEARTPRPFQGQGLPPSNPGRNYTTQTGYYGRNNTPGDDRPRSNNLDRGGRDSPPSRNVHFEAATTGSTWRNGQLSGGSAPITRQQPSGAQRME